MKLLLILIFVCLPLPAFSKDHLDKVQVLFIVPDKAGPHFWTLVNSVAQSAADDLNFKLEVVYSNSDRFAILEEINRISKRSNKPDYLIIRPFWGNESDIFQSLLDTNIPFVTIEAAYDNKKISFAKLKSWVSKVEFDDEQGGQLLADSLIKTAQIRFPEQQIGIVGLGGNFDLVSLNRQKYLKNLYKKDNKNVLVHQLVPLYWRANDVASKLPVLLKRFTNTQIIWTAGDQMALAALDSVKYKPGSYVIGGFDWLSSALKEIDNGRLQASVGGHFLMGAHALIDIYNHHHGLSKKTNTLVKRKYELIDASNVSEYLDFFENKRWQEVDFEHFTRKVPHNKILTAENIMSGIR